MRIDYFYRVKVAVRRVRHLVGATSAHGPLARCPFIIQEVSSVGCWCLLLVGCWCSVGPTVIVHEPSSVGCWLLVFWSSVAFWSSVGCWLLAVSVLGSLLHLCCTCAEGIRAPFGVTVRVEMNGTARTTMSLIAMRSNVRAVPYLSAGNTRQPRMEMKFS
jgi:hypothetical protein